VVKSIKIVMEEINKTCKALKSRAFYYNIYKIIFFIRYYIRCESVYKTYVNCLLKSIEDVNERKNQINFSVQQNIITQEEANELY